MIEIMSRSRVKGFAQEVFRSPGGLYIKDYDAFLDPKNNVLAVLHRAGERLAHLIPGENIVTDTGDIYYAQEGAAEATTNAFGIIELTSGREVASTPAKDDDRSDYDTLVIGSTQKAHDGTYPKTNDVDADNTGTTGTDVVTFLTSYTKADFNAASITHGIITNVTPGATEPILAAWEYAAAFEKTANDTLKNFVNHRFNGV